MKSATNAKHMTRFQVQEKFKKNFQALCAQCPQLTRSHDTLDDSLTSLQWLWNLNVNISNPTDYHGKCQSIHLNNGLLPPFPRNLLNGFDSDVIPSPVLFCGKPQRLSITAKSNPSDKNCSIQSTQSLNFTKSIVKNGNGISRELSKKNVTAHMIERSNCSVSTEPNRYLSLTSSTRRMRRGASFSVSSPSSNLARVESHVNNLDFNNKPHFPQIMNTNHDNNSEEGIESMLSDVCSPRHYSFSPREAMLDIMPGQVDYKNNPYVKPTFSFTTLICMALRSHKSHRLSLTGICKWITDNFMYYRYADPGWQNSIKLNLTQSKYFSKIHKKKDTANCLWEITREYKTKLKTVTLQNGNLQDTSPCLEADVNNGADICNNSLTTQSLAKMENEDSSAASRKRKQTSPQKLIRRRGSAKKRRENVKTNRHQNLLQEEAPELGSLKGDFNWNTIFDEFFGDNDEDLSVTPTSLVSRLSTHDDGHEVTSRFSDDVASVSLLSQDLLILPDLPDTNNESCRITFETNKKAPKKSSKDILLNSPHNAALSRIPLNFTPTDQKNTNVQKSTQNLDHDSFKAFLEEVGELDLMVVGQQVVPTPSCVSECTELEDLLCGSSSTPVLTSSPCAGEIEQLCSTASSSESFSVVKPDSIACEFDNHVMTSEMVSDSSCSP